VFFYCRDKACLVFTATTNNHSFLIPTLVRIERRGKIEKGIRYWYIGVIGFIREIKNEISE